MNHINNKILLVGFCSLTYCNVYLYKENMNLRNKINKLDGKTKYLNDKIFKLEKQNNKMNTRFTNDIQSLNKYNFKKNHCIKDKQDSRWYSYLFFNY